MTLQLRAAGECRWDIVSLGEVMLRLDPGDQRIATTREFRVWEGGGEYNVARGLRRCFGMRSAIVTALADNAVGRLIEDLMLQGGVEFAQLEWAEYDGIGRAVRNGLNFTERGFGVRAALGVSDRASSAASQLRPGDIDWRRIFEQDGTRWFHCGGIFSALSETTAAVALEAIAIARELGTVISYDLNFRESLWRSAGGPARAARINDEIVRHVDVLIGNEEDYVAALGFQTSSESTYLELEIGAYGELLDRVFERYPSLHLAAITLRQAKTASVNDWTGVCRTPERFIAGPRYEALQIYDRIGGGDSFASGLIYGLMAGRPTEDALAYGVAHGALAMTTPGDTSMATLRDVERLVRGGGARVER